MNQDLDALILIRNLSSSDFERFRTAVQMLTSRTFIIRGIDRERELYDFTIRNIPLFEAWFSCMNAELVRDESLGVIAFRGPANTRLFFSKDEICGVLALRLLYEEKRNETTLTKFPVITIGDFLEKFKGLAGGEGMNKTTQIRVFSRLSSCKLIFIEGNDYLNPDLIMQLYPSIPMSIDRNALDAAMEYLDLEDEKDIDSESMEGEE